MLNSNKTTNAFSTFSRTLEKSVIEEYRKAVIEAIKEYDKDGTDDTVFELLSDELIINSIMHNLNPVGVAWAVLH